MNAEYFVYALKSIEHNWIYVGITDNLQRRLKQHNQGQNYSTKHYVPLYLFYSEILPDRPHARKREKYLKTAAGKMFLRKQLEKFIISKNHSNSADPEINPL
jgi:putative endonuclease